MNRWNNVKEKLPDGEAVMDGGMPGYDAFWCFVITSDDGIGLAFYNEQYDRWYDNHEQEVDVAYWMMPPSLGDLNESVS